MNWFYTNSEGLQYMTLLGCSINDLWVVILLATLCCYVVYQYFDIGIFHYSKFKNYPNSITKSYLLQKINVFAFCAISGYGYRVLSVFVNPYKILIILLIILCFWTYRFRKSMRKTDVIDRIFENEQKIKDLERSVVASTLAAKQIRLKVNQDINQESMFISFDTIKDSFPVGSKQKMGDGKLIYGLDYFENDLMRVIVLRGFMPKGTSYSWNHHDCDEYIFSVSGDANETKQDIPFALLKIHELGIKIDHGIDALENYDFYSLLIQYK